MDLLHHCVSFGLLNRIRRKGTKSLHVWRFMWEFDIKRFGDEVESRLRSLLSSVSDGFPEHDDLRHPVLDPDQSTWFCLD